MAIRTFIPEAIIALHQEIKHHPLLVQRIQKHTPGDFPTILAEVAAYCNIALNDWYNMDDLTRIAELCLERLKKVNRPRDEIYIPPEDWARFIDSRKKGH